MVIFPIPCHTVYIFTRHLTVRAYSGSAVFIEVCALMCAILDFADFRAYHYFLTLLCGPPQEGLPME